MKRLWARFLAWLKRSAVHFGLILVFAALVSWQVRGIGDVLVAWFAFLLIEGVVGLIKGRIR